jgi:signal transduction histidine kinase
VHPFEVGDHIAVVGGTGHQGNAQVPYQLGFRQQFRATQEILFNVVKHAGVNEATIRARRMGRYVCLSASDQGQGFEPQVSTETSGIGLFSIHERVEQLGGRMKIRSVRDKGSRFRIVVPDELEIKRQAQEKT